MAAIAQKSLFLPGAPMPATALSVSAGVVTILLLAGCSSGAESTRGGPTGEPVDDPGVAHVHGLGVDPADGVLYAATHFGLFALPEDGEATRVADRFQDTMGFTVVGPNTFLGSGHPDFQKDPELPPRLGLIRSTDAAQTWETVSLSGEVDFHALHASGGMIFGWDSGSSRLMASADDGRTWDTRSALGLRDFAVGDATPDVLLATTERGLVRSSDGGRTFAVIPAAPPLTVLAWQEGDEVFGVGPTGAAYASRDGGSTWTERAAVGGEPEALVAQGEDLYVAVSNKGVLASTDGGRTWTVRYSEAS